MKKLIFEASAFRDWTLAYCQLVHHMWITEFKKQYGWGLSDICFEWNSKYTTMYRAPSEHLGELAVLINRKLDHNPYYLDRMCQKVARDVVLLEKYFSSLHRLRFEDMPQKEARKKFQEFKDQITKTPPSVLITIYYPQAIHAAKGMGRYKKFAKQAIALRDKVDHIVGPKSNQWLDHIIKSLLKRHGLKPEFSRFVSIQDIAFLLQDCLLHKRKSAMVSTWSKRKKYWITGMGKVHEITIESYLKKKGWTLKKQLKSNSLKGTPYGPKGEIRGQVVIVESKAELYKMKKGKILVAPMTTPEYAPIITKAKLIITDEGGITCHAAIISRELGIPSIVGTRTASKVLKDDDHIICKLTKGTIRKMRK